MMKKLCALLLAAALCLGLSVTAFAAESKNLSVDGTVTEGDTSVTVKDGTVANGKYIGVVWSYEGDTFSLATAKQLAYFDANVTDGTFAKTIEFGAPAEKDKTLRIVITDDCYAEVVVAAKPDDTTPGDTTPGDTTPGDTTPDDTGRRSSGGGGGGGGAYSSVTKTPAANGSYDLSSTTASAGATVKITPKPNAGYEVDAVTVTDRNGNAITVTKNADGTYSFTMPASALQPVKTAVTFKKAASASTGFADVPADAYYAAAVNWAVEQGITNGTGENTFSPESGCTRAQMVTFLWRAAGSPEPVNTANPFVDIGGEDSYYFKAVLWAVEQNITNGTGVGVFSPDAAVTRAQVVTFLYRYEKAAAGDAGAFADVPADAWYADAVGWAVEQGITNGTGDNQFSPDAVCTRGQIVTFLWRDMA